ncbi:MAG: hypothetical protein ACYDHY_15010 [Acidiferrobacterales bacterium]
MTEDTRFNISASELDGWPGTVKDIAVETWNTHIAPPLREAFNQARGDGAAEGHAVFDTIARSGAWAWFEFCDRRVTGNPETAAELGEELRSRLAVALGSFDYE